MARIRFNLDIRSIKDAEAARKLFNHCIFNGYYLQAKDVAKAICGFFNGQNSEWNTLLKRLENHR